MPHSQFVNELLFGVEPFYILTYLIAGSIAAAGFGYKILKFLNVIDSRGQNQNKALCVMANHMDDETARLHPDDSLSKIKPTIDTILNNV